MCVEDRIAKWVRRWTQEWEEDLERRPDEIKNSGSGRIGCAGNSCEGSGFLRLGFALGMPH